MLTYAGVNDCLTHLRALLVLHNTAAFWPTQLLALLGIIPPTEVTQRLVLWLGFYDSDSGLLLSNNTSHPISET